MRNFKEKVFTLLYIIFAKNLPRTYHSRLSGKLRVFFGRRILKYCGKGVNIERGAIFNSSCSLGDYSGIGIKSELNGFGGIIIGKYVSMGPEVVVYTCNHSTKRTDIPIQMQGYDELKPVTIEDDVWIGRRVIILPGVTIGKGSVIGAGAVVSKDIPPYSIAVGVPARPVKNRKDYGNEENSTDNS